MTKQEFIIARESFYIQFKKFEYIGFVAILGLMIVPIFIFNYFFGFDLGTANKLGFVTFIVLSVIYYGRKREKMFVDSGLNCISCNQSMMSMNSDIAVATGSCPSCGEKAFDE